MNLTVGVDVGAKSEFYNLLDRLRKSGTAILFYSSDDEELLSLCDRVLVLHDGKRLLDKFLGMDHAVAHDYNLYFYTWFENVRYCIEHRIPLYQSGQGLHGVKRRLGSRLSPNWLWYRHRNRGLDAILAVVERLARLDRHDPELATLLRESAP